MDTLLHFKQKLSLWALYIVFFFTIFQIDSDGIFFHFLVLEAAGRNGGQIHYINFNSSVLNVISMKALPCTIITENIHKPKRILIAIFLSNVLALN